MPIALLRTILTLRGLVTRGGFSAEVLEVITADTNLDPGQAMRELGISMTGLDDMISHGPGLAHQG